MNVSKSLRDLCLRHFLYNDNLDQFLFAKTRRHSAINMLLRKWLGFQCNHGRRQAVRETLERIATFWWFRSLLRALASSAFRDIVPSVGIIRNTTKIFQNASRSGAERSSKVWNSKTPPRECKACTCHATPRLAYQAPAEK